MAQQKLNSCKKPLFDNPQVCQSFSPKYNNWRSNLKNSYQDAGIKRVFTRDEFEMHLDDLLMPVVNNRSDL